MRMMRCVCCQGPIRYQGPDPDDWWDAESLESFLSADNIPYASDDAVCIPCGRGYYDEETAKFHTEQAKEVADRKLEDESRPIMQRSIIDAWQETWCTFPADLTRKLPSERKKQMFQKIQTIVDEYVNTAYQESKVVTHEKIQELQELAKTIQCKITKDGSNIKVDGEYLAYSVPCNDNGYLAIKEMLKYLSRKKEATHA